MYPADQARGVSTPSTFRSTLARDGQGSVSALGTLRGNNLMRDAADLRTSATLLGRLRQEPTGPGGMERVRRSVRSQDLRLVPALEPARRGFQGCHPGGPCIPLHQDEVVQVRPRAQLPRMAEDGNP